MSERIHILAKQLFEKSTIGECSVDEITNLTQLYPYFAPAQFLLLEKLKQQDPNQYTAQLQKSILYYHNPLAFQEFISSDKFYTESFVHSASTIAKEEIQPEEINEALVTTTKNNAEEITNLSTLTDVDNSAIKDEEIQPEPQRITEPEEINEVAVTTTENSAEEIINLSIIPDVDNDTPAIQEEEIQSEPQKLTEEPAEIIVTEKPQGLNQKSETELTFEPFHTVDYFASQGIKLSLEEFPTDKFGKQLKSFTEWLKTMKRIPSTQIQKTAESFDFKVQHLAEDSIHKSDVWTEAMAEVWIKQNNPQKAIEVYNKLVLLNPSKKAYFAEKIENLKQ